MAYSVFTDGRYATVAKLRPGGYYIEHWNFTTNLEIRPEQMHHDISPTCIYPHQMLIPELERSGFKGDFYRLTPFDLFHVLLSDSRAETLLKAGRTNELKYFTDTGFKNIDNFWASVKICIRNGYQITDISMWCDYINLLRFFGKDLHNAKYVCPADLNTEHDRYVRKKKEWLEQQRKEKATIKVLEDTAHFNEMKSRFFGIQFTDGLIQVRVLETVEEIMQEGEAMHHCIFTNDYHLKPDTLILSACIGDRRIETVELSLSRLEVLQSRGVCNKNTEYHDRIVSLVNSNVSIIKKRLAA